MLIINDIIPIKHIIGKKKIMIKNPYHFSVAFSSKLTLQRPNFSNKQSFSSFSVLYVFFVFMFSAL